MNNKKQFETGAPFKAPAHPNLLKLSPDGHGKEFIYTQVSGSWEFAYHIDAVTESCLYLLNPGSDPVSIPFNSMQFVTINNPIK